MKPVTITNVHSHIFTIKHVPEKFLPLGLVKVFENKRAAKIILWILQNVYPFSHFEICKRICAFANAARHDTQAEILEDMRGFYPENTRFAVLAMDFEHMEAGKPKKSFKNQIDELGQLKKAFPDRLYPFAAVDPRHHDILKFVKTCIEEDHFAGIKLYPPMGFYPFDARLNDVYSYAEDHQIPITVHCAPHTSLVHWRGKIPPGWRKHPRTGEILTASDNCHFVSFFTHPANYYWVLDDHPNLKLNFGHFGGAAEWDKYLDDTWPAEKRNPVKPANPRLVCPGDVSWLSTIRDMLPKYPNLYADVSYLAYKEKYLSFIKVLVNTSDMRERILFGSDCYMLQMDDSERAFSLGVRGYLGEDDFRQIAETNPQKFIP